MIAYEAVRNGWAKKPPVLDKCFEYLKSENVRFFKEDHADGVRKELKSFNKVAKRPPDDDDDDDSDSEDAFDNWWFHDDSN